jgi:dual specificity protein kinase YAK1
MDPQWQSYSSDPNMSRSGRFAPNFQPAPPNSREYNEASQQHQPPAGYTYEAYPTPSTQSHPQSMATSPSATPSGRDYIGDGDVAMEDADPYNRMKYPLRPSHQHRVSAQYLTNEESSAGRRYSPMNTLSPASPYGSSPKQQSQNSYTFNSQIQPTRQSPTRPNPYSAAPQQFQSPS